MLSILFLAALAAPPASLDESTPALRARILRELDRPQAVADLFRLYERRDEKGDLTPLLSALDQAVRSPKSRPDVRALALEIRGELLLSIGQLPKAAGEFEKLAEIPVWSILGPFDNEARAGLLAEYPPEKEGFDPKAVYHGKEHDVTWRALPPRQAPYGFVDLGAAVYPRSDVAVYAATVLKSPKASNAIFHLGASGATRVWVNGKLVHEDAALHPSRFDQNAFEAPLQAGDNFVLVKIAHSSGRLGFSLRVADGKDAPLPEVAKSARAPDTATQAFAAAVEGARKKAPPAKKPLDALDELRAAAAKDPSDPRAQEDLAVLLTW